ncbi:MAG: N-6 DNA methylase [Alphaproteobacteria bacterium]|nr:N-6 DNA methylase [Alphaproteobacteria bacterium]
MDNIDKKILKIHNYIYANDGLSNAETLTEFLKIFYCKILDENDGNMFLLLTNEADILRRVNNLYKSFQTKLNNVVKTSEKINLKDRTIIFIISELRDINIKNISSDIKGHIMQKIIDRSYRESRGQFFTPAPVVDFIVKMIAPKKNELGSDPASGTGGFLFAALDYISNTKKITIEDIKNMYFSDISKNLIQLILMRMMFEYSIDDFNYYTEDSIAKDVTPKYDFVITNPPFGTQGKVDDPKILSKYDLSYDGKKYLSSQVPDILFVEQIIKSLKYGGRAAVVLPDGDFENPSLQYFREFLVNNVKIDAIVSLPDGTFIPYGTGVKSSIIFFTKQNSTYLNKIKNENYSIFYARIHKLGYTFSKHSKSVYTKEGAIDEDYSQVLDAYKKGNYNENSYLVSINEIERNNYILAEHFYSPVYSQLINSIKQNKYAMLKDLVSFRNSKEKINIDEKYTYIEIGDVSPYINEITNSTSLLGDELPSRASYIVHTGDVIVAVAGNAIGTEKHAKAIVSDKYDGCICTNGFIVLSPIKVSAYFILSFLNSEYFLKQVLKYKYGTAIPCISKEDLGNVVVPIPDDEKMREIENRIKRAYNLRKEANELLYAV